MVNHTTKTDTNTNTKSDTDLLPTTEKIEKNYERMTFKTQLQKNVYGFIRKMKFPKTDENKKDWNRNNEVKSVVIIGDSMIKHLNG